MRRPPYIEPSVTGWVRRFLDIIVRLRLENRVTYEGLMRAIGRSSSTFVSWCHGKSRPTVEQFVGIADHIKMTLAARDWVLYGTLERSAKLKASAR